MELKKSKKADLERNRTSFLQIGLLLALSLTLIAFDWKTKPDESKRDKYFSETLFEPEVIQNTRREDPKPQIIQKKLTDILNIVPDEIVIDENFNFNVEANPDTRFDFIGFTDEVEKIEETFDFLPIEDMPTFNGGNPAIEFRKYISQNLHYPEIAAENGVKGKVYVQFVINTKGQLVDAEIIGAVDPALDKEALRVILTSPLWSPGKQRGKPVKVRFTFPIAFVLQ
jgi:periplasmic protein TonB